MEKIIIEKEKREMIDGIINSLPSAQTGKRDSEHVGFGWCGPISVKTGADGLFAKIESCRNISLYVSGNNQELTLKPFARSCFDFQADDHPDVEYLGKYFLGAFTPNQKMSKQGQKIIEKLFAQ